MENTMEEAKYSNLTKAQRKRLKRERKEQEKEIAGVERQRKQIKKKIRNYGIIIIIILAVVGFFYWKSVPAKDAPLLELETADYSFGQVSQSQGIAKGELMLTNTGKSDLVIKSMLSSCGCTSASLVVNGVEGPKFGMHNNPTDWSAAILPGETAKLRIYYDPNKHPELKGPVTRTITIYSNAHRSPHKLTIHANQVP